MSIKVQADSGRIPISPLIYGKNGCGVSDDPAKPSKDSAGTTLFLSREAGLRMARENAGNNLTKYNWRKKLTSHPDWYNNVYAHDWDFAAKELQTKLPGVQGFYGFQLLGWVASNTANNFDDWSFNKAQYWSGIGQNLAGGDFFTPWSWDAGMWEVLHLFSRYARADRVKSTSSVDTVVSAYSVTTYLLAKPTGSVGLARSEHAANVRIVRTSDGIDLSGGPRSGTVALRDAAGAVIARTRWDAGRAFRLRGPAAGHRLRDLGGRRQGAARRDALKRALDKMTNGSGGMRT